MANNVGNYKRIAKNTLMLYIRMLLVTLVSLYTVRVLLATLGQEDYGLYNVVGGIVVMLSFLTHTLTSASQRFYSYNIAQKNHEQLNRVYSSTLLLYAAVVCLIVVLAETVGLWFLNNHMTIPQDRIIAANVVYQFSILSFCWKVFTTAHQALIIAYERMSVYAYVSIAEVMLQLLVVFALTEYNNDKLILYAILVFATHFLTNGFYILYSKLKFNNVKFLRPKDLKIIKEISSYSGWTLLGMLSIVVRSSGINIVLNVFFNPIVNAARGIAFTAYSFVSTLTGNFYTAVRPQIVKNYSKHDLDACHKLIFRSTLFSYSLALLIVLPLIVFAPEVLNLWLGEYPPNTVVFMRLSLITALIDSIANPLNTYNQATGKIRKYQIITSVLLILNLPLCIVAFYCGTPAIAAFIISIIISFLANIVRLIINNIEHGFPSMLYVRKVVSRIILVTLTSTLLVPLIFLIKPHNNSIIYLCVDVFVLCLWVGICSLCLGFEKNDRKLVVKTVLNKIKH